MTNSKKISVTFKLSLKARQLLTILSRKEGTNNKTAELENAIREYARNKGIDYTKDLSRESGVNH